MSDAALPEWTVSQRLRVTHLTRYRYEGNAWDSFNEARLHPVTDTAQQLVEFHLRVEAA